MLKMVKKLYSVDYRFFVKAKEAHLAADELLNRLPETDDILYMYTPITLVSEFKEDPIKDGVKKEEIQKALSKLDVAMILE